ncbi:heat-inducible transcriptional repressor HrcA [Brevibacterium sp. 50QC2O2]|uniref:heat-inducible transcriptional repressor HrcA n=1 Tax=Brevibacterium TaxID=1696 RepID=UPI00211BD471|nr:heat-inducible transcriptional repressor HrcA [Brevibacterium sp. 91QC2O2]MCQ9384081.1 heat-inducible transcriptional repressor HrcA [Brevibacterium sp. 68QC2CO]MCQ9388441.1 heat-inducible transcriptional repressor HrcA [Brevibacterium sp. 50QC2O2]
MNDDRRNRVLRAIIEDYVATNEPVGSKALVDRHGLRVSPATIRNDMAALEQDGLIAQPHTSAGRIPTDKGYRVFVDRLDDVKPLSTAERRAISRVLQAPVDIDDMLERTVRLLSGLTHQVALVQYPTASQTRVRHVELVELTPGRLLAVLITDSGQVEQRVVDLGDDVVPVDPTALRDGVNRALRGVRLARIDTALDDLQVPAEHAAAGARLAEVLKDLARLGRQDRLLMAGTANLARAGGEFFSQIAPLLDAFEEQVVLLRLLSSMAQDSEPVAVRIGHENDLESFSSTSVIASPYGGPEAGARLAVLGPTRMDYPTTMAAVRAVAKYVSVILSD